MRYLLKTVRIVDAEKVRPPVNFWGIIGRREFKSHGLSVASGEVKRWSDELFEDFRGSKERRRDVETPEVTPNWQGLTGDFDPELEQELNDCVL